jgi:hypothetical protein
LIPFGPWHPDAAGTNSPAMLKAKGCLPAVLDTNSGPVPAYAPELQPQAVSDALDDAGKILDDASNIITDDLGATIFDDASSQCLGLVSTVQNNGTVVQVAGTATALFKLVATSWNNVTRASGGPYATLAGERWRFAAFNPYILATNYSDNPQKFDTSVSPSTTKFVDLGGSPPKARFIAIVRDQVVLGGLNGTENGIQWSGYNNAEDWSTTGLTGGDTQSFPDGGPLTGLVGGAVGHIYQASKVTRMTLTQTTAPDGTPLIYQFDEVQGGKGCVASNSIVKVGDQVFYFASDGFQVLSISTGQVKPIGVNKWRQWFLEDYRPGTEGFILGAYDPLNPLVKWAYISNSVTGFVPGRVINYNWAIDEATYEDLSVEAISQWLTSGVTMDSGLSASGNMDTLPFSLDSPFWKGGVPLLSIVDSNHKLNYLEGTPMQAEFITADGMGDGRAFIRGTTPIVDTTAVTVAVSMRERDGDAVSNNVVFPTQEVMEDTGMVSAHTSGNIARAQIIIPAGSKWTMLKGLKTSLGRAGGR